MRAHGLNDFVDCVRLSIAPIPRGKKERVKERGKLIGWNITTTTDDLSVMGSADDAPWLGVGGLRNPPLGSSVNKFPINLLKIFRVVPSNRLLVSA